MSSATTRQARLLEDVLKLPGNDVCADCRSQSPRWASVNLGIFLCVQCASVHRKMGTHNSRVKSVTMDTWTREQVDAMRQIGNLLANSRANPLSHPPPPSTSEFDERGGELEKYIRRKWEYGSFRSKSPSGGEGGGRGSPTGRELRPQGSGASGGSGGSGGSGRVPGVDGRRSRNEELNDIILPRTKDAPLPSLPPPSPQRVAVFNANGRTQKKEESKPGRGAKGLVDENWADLLGMGESLEVSGAPMGGGAGGERPRLQYAAAPQPQQVQQMQAPTMAVPARTNSAPVGMGGHPFPLAAAAGQGQWGMQSQPQSVGMMNFPSAPLQPTYQQPQFPSQQQQQQPHPFPLSLPQSYAPPQSYQPQQYNLSATPLTSPIYTPQTAFSQTQQQLQQQSSPFPLAATSPYSQYSGSQGQGASYFGQQGMGGYPQQQQQQGGMGMGMGMGGQQNGMQNGMQQQQQQGMSQQGFMMGMMPTNWGAGR